MVSKSILVSKLNPYIGSAKVVKYDQSTTDIVNELLKSHNKNKTEYDKIYKYFNYPTEKKTLQNLFDFCKKNIDYRIESGDNQSLKTPTAILVQGFGDCKQYAQFIGGVLDAINRNNKKIDWCYRFASYNPQHNIQHVFVVVKTKSGEVWIDPVLDYLNDKKQYNYKIDKKMSLYTISGFDDEIGAAKKRPIVKKPIIKKQPIKVVKGTKLVVSKSVIDKVKLANKRIPVEKLTTKIIAQAKKDGKFVALKAPTGAKQPAAPRKKKRGLKALSIKKAGSAIKKAAGQVKTIALKVGLSPARNAFLLLVRLNVFGLGKAMAQNWLKISKEWEKLGGAPSKLKAAINKGQSIKVSGVDDYNHDSIGTPVAAVVAAALPIIAKLSSFLKAAGVDVDGLIKKGKDAVIDKVTGKLLKGDSTDLQVPKDLDIETTNESGIKTTVKSSSTGEPTVTMTSASGESATQTESEKQATETTETETPTTKAPMDYKKYLVPAAAVLALYFITKKK